MLSYALVFFVLGSFNLVRLAWTDIRSFLVDQRISQLMMGVVLTLFFLEARIIELLVVVFVCMLLLGEIKKRKFLFGVAEGDLSIMAWVIPGLWFLGVWHLALFCVLYVLGLAYFYFWVKKDKGFPVSVVIAVAFIITWAMSGLFL